MNNAVAIFVKTPGLSPLKTRLSKDIGQKKAETFHLLSAYATASALKNHTDSQIYWAVAEEQALGHNAWKDHPTIFQGNGDLAHRQYQVYNDLRQKHENIMLIGADAPLIKPVHLKKGFRDLKQMDYCLGMAFDGGYYLLSGRKEISLDQFQSVPYSKDITFQEMSKALLNSGTLQVLDFEQDIDTFDDIRLLSETYIEDETTKEQREILDFIKNLDTF